MDSHLEAPVTVLIPVRNGVKWIPKMLESILGQRYGNFEILLIDDASSDNSAGLARTIAGDRLRVVIARGEGLASALALGVVQSDTELICRMDVDDIADSHRLTKQVDFLTRNPSHVMVGSNINLIDSEGKILGQSRLPEADAEIRLRMSIGNPFAHSSVMFRRASVLAVGNYWSPDKAAFPEDYHLWARLADTGLLANLSERLVQYRVHDSGVLQSNSVLFRRHACDIAIAWRSKESGSQISATEIDAWRACYGSNTRISPTQALVVARALARARLTAGSAAARGLRVQHYLVPFSRVLRGPGG